jgi:hypothetical protein
MSQARTVVNTLIEAGTGKRLVDLWKSEGPLRRFQKALDKWAKDLSHYYTSIEPRMEGSHIIVDTVPTRDYLRTSGKGGWKTLHNVKGDMNTVARTAGLNVDTDIEEIPVENPSGEYIKPRRYRVRLTLK